MNLLKRLHIIHEALNLPTGATPDTIRKAFAELVAFAEIAFSDVNVSESDARKFGLSSREFCMCRARNILPSQYLALKKSSKSSKPSTRATR